MSIITRMRRQKAVYWKRGTNTDSFGNYQYHQPVEISVRWENEDVQKLNADGTMFTSKTQAFVDRDMNSGDVLLEGVIDRPLNSDPLNNKGAFEVKTIEKIPNLKASEFVRIAYL